MTTTQLTYGVNGKNFLDFLHYENRGYVPPSLFFDETLEKALSILQKRGTLFLKDNTGRVYAHMRNHPIDSYEIIPVNQ